MDFSIWKKIASYFWEFKVEEIKSEYSEKLEVCYHKNNFKLSTKNAVYSFGNHYTSFKDAFNYININKQKIHSALILGVGIGSVVQQLNKNPYIQSITAVDIDKKIINLCQKYLKTKFKIDYIQADAYHFLDINTNNYDLIIVDLFIDEITPSIFLSIAFLEMLNKSLSKNGFLLFSKLETTRQHKVENNNFSKLFSQLFPTSFSINTNGNKVFIFKND